jgi:prepilin-type processing-associated H-X9-DG protein
MPAIYRSPLQSREETSRTTYVVPVGGGAIFEKKEPTQFKQITDGTSNTIMTVEVDPKHAVIWTKPDDLSFNPKQPFEGIGKPYPKGFNAGFADGSVHFLPYTLPDATLSALFTRAGGEVAQAP